MSDGTLFTNEIPVYEKGREVIIEQPKSQEEIMANNPSFSSAQMNQENGDQEDEGYLQRASTMAYSSMGFFWQKSRTAYEKSGEAIYYVGTSL